MAEKCLKPANPIILTYRLFFNGLKHKEKHSQKVFGEIINGWTRCLSNKLLLILLTETYIEILLSLDWESRRLVLLLMLINFHMLLTSFRLQIGGAKPLFIYFFVSRHFVFQFAFFNLIFHIFGFTESGLWMRLVRIKKSRSSFVAVSTLAKKNK